MLQAANFKRQASCREKVMPKKMIFLILKWYKLVSFFKISHISLEFRNRPRPI